MSTDTQRELFEKRDAVLLDHLINLTHQVRTLAGILRDRGMDIPATIGTLGPASVELVAIYTQESYRRHLPAGPPSDPGGPV